MSILPSHKGKKLRKRYPGRPPMAEGTAHTSVFSLKLSDEERDKLRAAAERSEKTLSQWARDALLAAADETSDAD